MNKKEKINPFTPPKSRSGNQAPYRVALSFPNPTLTKQAFKDECDINKILARFQKTGAITHLQNNKAEYGFATSRDFTESMYIVAKAQSMFNDLPSSIRNKFENDPAKFLNFVQDDKNADELVELGLANAPAPSPVPSDEVASDERSLAPSKDPAPDPPPEP